jgi:hypothetical protein
LKNVEEQKNQNKKKRIKTGMKINKIGNSPQKPQVGSSWTFNKFEKLPFA